MRRPQRQILCGCQSFATKGIKRTRIYSVSPVGDIKKASTTPPFARPNPPREVKRTEAARCTLNRDSYRGTR